MNISKVKHSMFDRLRAWFVTKVWATHNESNSVKEAVSRVVRVLGPGQLGLNVGCGATKLHDRIINLDIVKTPTVDIVADAQYLPFRDESFDVVVTQETIEHIPDPFQAIREITRVLRRGGYLYCQVPFVIGYHPGPTDFWRFTRQGVEQLVQHAGLRVVEVGFSVGPGTGLYRILVEFVATTIARVIPRLYIPVKDFHAVIFFPLKWLDPFLIRSCQADRIAGGYYVIARKE